jgi:hypothetical protein
MAGEFEGILAMGIGFGILMFFLVLAMIAFAIFLFVFWILMIIDCVTRKFKNDTDKIVWILVLILIHILGAVIYYFVVKRNDKKKN